MASLPPAAPLEDVSNCTSPEKKRARSGASITDDGARDCPICLEPWGQGGAHRIAVLKCGHLFGKECIERWISGNKNCPSCHQKASRKDLRLLFVSTVSVQDTGNLDRVQRELAAEKRLRVQAEMDKVRLRVQVEALQQQLSSLSSRRPHPSHPSSSSSSSSSSSVPSSLSPSKATPPEASKAQCPSFKPLFSLQTRGSRVVQLSSSRALLLTSYSLGSASKDHGIHKVSLDDPRHSQTIHCHDASVKDMKLSPRSHLVLTTSQDKTLKVVDTVTNRAVLTYNLERPGWSCEWDHHNEHNLYCGSMRGEILSFDLRKTAEAVSSYSVSGCMAPLHTLLSFADASIEGRPSLLCGSVSGVWVATAASPGTMEYAATWESRSYGDLPGTCVSLCLRRPPSGTAAPPLAAASLRGGGTADSCAGHHLFDPSRRSGGLVAEGSVALRGHASRCVMSRACVFDWGKDEALATTFAASGDEGSNGVLLWDCGCGGVVQRLGAHRSPVLAVQHSSAVEGGCLLASASEAELKVYRERAA